MAGGIAVEGGRAAVGVDEGDSKNVNWPPPLGRDVSAALRGNGPAAVRALKEKLRWRMDDEEAEQKWCEQTGTSLLLFAVFIGSLGAVEELLRILSPEETMRDLHRSVRRGNFKYQLMKGMTPLHAAMFCSWPIASRLLDAGAEPKARITASGYTPLQLACFLTAHDCIRGWLQRFPSWDLEQKDRFGHTALTSVAFQAQGAAAVECAQLLMERGANAMHVIDLGSNLILLAAQNLDCSDGFVQYVLGIPALRDQAFVNMPIRARTRKWRMFYTFMRMLRRCGSRNAVVSFFSGFVGSTALHQAVLYQNLSMTRALVEAGADLGAKDEDGYTPLEYFVHVNGGQEPPKPIMDLLSIGRVSESLTWRGIRERSARNTSGPRSFLAALASPSNRASLLA